MKTVHIIALVFFVILSSSNGADDNLTFSKWKAEFFTDYSGIYELYKTEGKVSRIILTPYEALDRRNLLSVLKMESDDIGTQPRYHLMGDLVADGKNAVLRLQNGEKWEAVKFTCPILKKKIFGLRVKGVIYKRVRETW